MKKVLLFAAAIAIASLPYVFAVPGEGPGPGSPAGNESQEASGPDAIMEKNYDKALEDLKLTDEQREKIRAIREASKRDIMILRHEVQLAILDIQQEYKKDKSDGAKINSYIDKLSDAQKKLMKLRSAQMLKMKEVLTPEQFKQLLNKIDRVKAKAKKGFFDRFKAKK